MTSVETQKRWIIDKAHSNLEFSVRHMMIANVKGRFTKFDGDIILDPENIENSKFKIEIDASSIYTNEEDRGQLLLAKASELVAVLPSTREWRFIETQRLAG